jgi:glyoxylase-like metal-dependent hydrolase (beta-lactamase superfamily II)
MELVELRPELHLVRLSFAPVYLWRDGDTLTLIDTGIAAESGEIAAAIELLGLPTAALRTVVLTHCHQDHAGSAGELAAWPGVRVLAHRADAPVLRGEVPGPPPNFTPAEARLHRQVGAHLLPAAPPTRVDRELADGDTIEFGGGAVVVGTPGHTDGSIAVWLPAAGVLFTGDTVSNVGEPRFGVFHLDRPAAMASFRRLTELPVTLGCVGHGAPITEREWVTLREDGLPEA